MCVCGGGERERSYRIGGENVVIYLCVSKGRWVCICGGGEEEIDLLVLEGKMLLYIYV